MKLKPTCRGVSCNYTYVIWYALYLCTVTFIKITSGLLLFHNKAIMWVELNVWQKYFILLVILRWWTWFYFILCSLACQIRLLDNFFFFWSKFINFLNSGGKRFCCANDLNKPCFFSTGESIEPMSRSPRSEAFGALNVHQWLHQLMCWSLCRGSSSPSTNIPGKWSVVKVPWGGLFVPVHTLIIFHPTLIRGKQTDRCSLSPLFLLMRSQHISPHKSISAIIPSVSAYLGRGPTDAIKSAAFSASYHAQSYSPPIPSFSCSAPVSHLLRCSSLRLHSAPTHLSGFKCEYEWKDAESACDSLFPTSDSDHALISADFIVFSCGGAVEGQSGSHRENWHRRWGNDG